MFPEEYKMLFEGKGNIQDHSLSYKKTERLWLSCITFNFSWYQHLLNGKEEFWFKLILATKIFSNILLILNWTSKQNPALVVNQWVRHNKRLSLV